MPRKRPTKRQIVEAWEKYGGRCWRCGHKIAGKPTPRYGKDWVLGHAGAANWAGGDDLRPEHVDCNSEDARLQTKLAAKSVRIRARNIGVRSSRPLPCGRDSPWKKKVGGPVVPR